MKKDSLIITISDIHKSKSFSVNKVIKKIILWIVLTVLFVVSISFFTISQLNQSVNDLSIEKDKLRNENDLYSNEIASKIDQISELGSQLKEIEDIIGIDKEDDASLIQRATLAKLTSS